MGGPHPSGGVVSGSRTPPIIDLVGNSMAGLAHTIPTIPTIAERTGRRVIVIGGMAVLCRLTHPYRATSDIDTATGVGLANGLSSNCCWPAGPRRAGRPALWCRPALVPCRSMFSK